MGEDNMQARACKTLWTHKHKLRVNLLHGVHIYTQEYTKWKGIEWNLMYV